MEQRINITALLKDCSKNTMLYTPLLPCIWGQYNCRIDSIIDDEITVYGNETASYHYFNKYGEYKERGECLLFPSKDNRDWTTFKAPQKKQPKFKVGDVVKDTYRIEGKNYGVVVKDDGCDITLACFDPIVKNIRVLEGRFSVSECTLATPEEIAKWNKETLEPRHLHYSKSKRKIIHWFVIKDDVVVRQHKDSEWKLTTFSHYSYTNDIPYCASGAFWRFCLPYNEKTAKLIGTTDDWKEE